MAVWVCCGCCGSRLLADESMRGMTCSRCGAPVPIPAGAHSPAEAQPNEAAERSRRRALTDPSFRELMNSGS